MCSYIAEKGNLYVVHSLEIVVVLQELQKFVQILTWIELSYTIAYI